MTQTELTEVIFADDLVIVANSEKKLQDNLKVLDNELTKLNMKINLDKTKNMIISKKK